jgi:hypothetical protein
MCAHVGMFAALNPLSNTTHYCSRLVVTPSRHLCGNLSYTFVTGEVSSVLQAYDPVQLWRITYINCTSNININESPHRWVIHFRLPGGWTVSVLIYFSFIIIYLSRCSDRLGFHSRQGQDFSLLYSVQTGSGAHPASHPLGSTGFPPWVKRPRREGDQSTPSTTDVKNGRAIPTYVFMTWCLIN